MGLFDWLFGKSTLETSETTQVEHCLIVHFQYGLDNLDDLYNTADKLSEAVIAEGSGEYDGHEIAVDLSDGFYYLYGPNAEVLFRSVKPILEATAFCKGAKAKLRFGPPEDGVREIEVVI